MKYSWYQDTLEKKICSWQPLHTYNTNGVWQVVYYLDRGLEMAVGCTKLKVMKAECLAFLGRYQEAQELANDIVSADQTNADAIYVRGLCLYYQDSVDRAFSHFQHVLRLAPDHKKAMDIYKVSESNLCTGAVIILILSVTFMLV